MRYFIIISLLLSTSILVAQPLNDGCLNKVNGRIVNAQIDKAIPNATIFIKNTNGSISTIKADNNGNFSFNLPCDDKRYMVNATIENYTKSTKLIFTSRDYAKDHEITLDLIPVKEFVEINGRKRIIAESIIFPPNSKNIEFESIKELKRVFDILYKYPNIDVEIGIHSDSRGDDEYLLELTQKRAEACASYFINNGIESSRIVAKGYGTTQLLNKCSKGVKCSDENHLKNRRTEFIVVQNSTNLAQM